MCLLYVDAHQLGLSVMLLLSVIDSSFLTFNFNEMSSRQKQSNSLVKQGRGRRTRKTLGGQKTLLKIRCNL